MQCCFTSTERGRQGAKPVPSPVMVVPLLYTPNSTTVISCKRCLLASLFGTTQSRGKRHKCCLNVFISSIQFSSFIRSMGHFQPLSFPREHFTFFSVRKGCFFIMLQSKKSRKSQERPGENKLFSPLEDTFEPRLY